MCAVARKRTVPKRTCVSTAIDNDADRRIDTGVQTCRRPRGEAIMWVTILMLVTLYICSIILVRTVGNMSEDSPRQPMS